MIAVCVCIILLILVVWVHCQTEPFASTPLPTLDPELAKNYQTFVSSFYNPFMANWKKAITTSATSDIEQQPLTNPEQTSSSAPPTISNHTLNQHIMILSKQEGKSFPPITDPLPDTMDMNNYATLAPQIPTNPTPYNNALAWMNQQLADSHAKLESAMKGESFANWEGFDNQMCQDVSQCFKENPQLIQQLTVELQSQQQQQQQGVSNKIKSFLSNSMLTKGIATNQQLFARSQQIQNQAQSGELLNQLNLPDEPTIKYTLPDGADALNKMKSNDPARYQSVQKEAPSMFALKNMFDQINQNLR